MIMTVNTDPKYDIKIENGIINQIGNCCKELFPKANKVCIISDSNVFPLYGEKVVSFLQEVGFSASYHIIEAGEQSKNIETVTQMYSTIANAGLSRKDFLVALGGGVVGDMCGFVAATYMRGISFVQMPTSLLSQVDSSVGGKTGFDLKEGKNLVGAFWQPSLVLIDPDVLSTLDKRQYNSGMAEIIKMAALFDADMFAKLEDSNFNIADIIYRCVDLKRGVVERDEKELGERALLNFGHTVGHAIEKLTGYTKITHGEGVAIGMAYITKFSEHEGITQVGSYNRLVDILKQYSLPYKIDLNPQDIINATKNDKKASGNSIRIILLEKIGCSFSKVVNY